MQPIDVILTSYARWDLLDITLSSFFQHNTYPINKFVIHEDKGLKNFSDDDWRQLLKLQVKFPSIIWMTPNERLGQIKALDALHSCISTEYYLSLEDDWQCQNDYFISNAITLLEDYPKCCCVWLRGTTHEAVNSHPIELKEGGILKLSTNYHWKGFSFAPTLKRKREYEIMGPYQNLCPPFNPHSPWEGEKEIGYAYFNSGYYALTLPETYFTHIGGNGRGIRS